MFSLRQQLAARLPDWVDHAYAVQRGIGHAIIAAICRDCRGEYGCTRHFPYDASDSALVRCAVCARDNVPVPVVGAVAAGTRQGAATVGLGTPPPANHLARLLVCRRDLGGCGAQPGQRCTTKGGKVTGEHAARQRP